MPHVAQTCSCVGVAMGSYDNQEELPIPDHMASYRDARLAAGLGGTICIDRCILPEIKRLWSLGVRTNGCCCGHGVGKTWWPEEPAGYIGVYEDSIPTMLAEGYQPEPRAAVPGHFTWPRAA